MTVKYDSYMQVLIAVKATVTNYTSIQMYIGVETEDSGLLVVCYYCLYEREKVKCTNVFVAYYDRFRAKKRKVFLMPTGF